MKLQEASSPIEIQGQGTTNEFRLNFGSKAFRVLSDTLYSNKLGSVVREISCNAYDSHVMKGNPEVPFEVHLPDAFEPYFSVKDYGVGLSPEDVVEVFTVYFKSTKDQSNDCIGMLGLGSKSVFSYTDQFTVTSVHGGNRTIYSAYIAASGVPSIAVMHTEPSDEPTGVEIKMSAKLEDYTKFKQEVQQQLKYFKTKPLIKNGSVTWDSLSEALFATDNISVHKPSGYYSKNITLIQGNVGYPLNMDNLRNKPEISKETFEFLGTLTTGDTLIYFDIGQIGVTASREGVEYNKTTLINIEAKVQKCITDVKQHLDLLLTDCNTTYEKAIVLNKFWSISTLASLYKLQGCINTYGNFSFDLRDLIYGGMNKYTYISDMRMYVSGQKSVRYTTRHFNPVENLCVVIKDKGVLISKKIAKLLETHTNVLEVSMRDGKNDAALKQQIENLLGGFSNIVFSSSIILPKAERQRNQTKRTLSTYYVYPKGYDVYSAASWTKKTEDLEELEECCYVEVDRMRFTSDKTAGLVSKYKDLQMFCDTIPLIAVRKSADVTDSKFIKLEDYIKEKQAEYKQSKEYKTYVKYQKSADACATIGYGMNQLLNNVAELAKETKLVRMYKLATKAKKTYSQKLSSDASKVYYFVDEAVSSKLVENFDKQFKQELRKFPMLEILCDAYKHSFYPQHVAEYIKKFD